MSEEDFTPKLSPEDRSAVILSAAIEVANEKGLSEVSFSSTAAKCVMKTKPRTVAHYFKIGDLRRAVVNDDRANDDVRTDAIAMGIC
jgi:hypothetical protein